MRTNKDLNIRILTDTKIRVLSSSFFGAKPTDDSGPTHTITHNSGEKQWNTFAYEPYLKYHGFDFQECSLKDISPVKSTITQTNNPTSKNNIWIPTRGRMLIYIDATTIPNTRLHYQVSEVASEIAWNSEKTGIANSLLICPRDEGIGNNEPMTISIWRTRLNNSGAETETGEKLVLYCHTYAEPEIKITNPKNLKSHLSSGQGEDFNENYPLWATDVINKRTSEGIDDVIFICPVLSLMTTQDGLDDSGIPSFTRVSIREYPGYDLDESTGDATLATNKYDPYFSYPTNDNILNNSATKTCEWTGVFRDSDGSVVSISGMNDQQMIWTPKDGDVDNIKKYNDHTLKDGNDTKIDLRVCFRAGYKYRISVRRFHGYAAGYANINSSGYPQFGYMLGEQNSDYPCYYKSINNAGSIKVLTETGNTYRGDIYAGPPLNYDVDDNNKQSMYANNDEYKHFAWKGPYAGETQDDDTLYPGFSSMDSIIIDCVRNQTSRKNLVTVRPATQEISADHWITFGYRHLDRTPNGVDSLLTTTVNIRNSNKEVAYSKYKYIDKNGKRRF